MRFMGERYWYQVELRRAALWGLTSEAVLVRRLDSPILSRWQRQRVLGSVSTKSVATGLSFHHPSWSLLANFRALNWDGTEALLICICSLSTQALGTNVSQFPWRRHSKTSFKFIRIDSAQRASQAMPNPGNALRIGAKSIGHFVLAECPHSPVRCCEIISSAAQAPLEPPPPVLRPSPSPSCLNIRTSIIWTSTSARP